MEVICGLALEERRQRVFVKRKKEKKHHHILGKSDSLKEINRYLVSEWSD